MKKVIYYEVYLKTHWWSRRQPLGKFYTLGSALDYQKSLIEDGLKAKLKKRYEKIAFFQRSE